MFKIFKKKEGSCEVESEAVTTETKEITIDDFSKVEIRAGEILSAEKVENADRLLKLEVCFGNHKRQIVSGIAEHFPDPEKLIGTICPFVTNLQPRTIKGLESNGMIMAVGGKNGVPFSLLNINRDVVPGTRIS
jgi:methionyl-tRNA synthetase